MEVKVPLGTLQNMCKLLKLFSQYTLLVTSEEYTTLSSVIPILMELNLHIKHMKKIPELSDILTLLQSELKRRFRKFTDPGDNCFEPLFVVSTILDPRYKPLINPNQAKAGKAKVLQLLTESNGGTLSSSSSAHSASPAAHQEELEDSPPKKRSCFSRLAKVLEQKLNEALEKLRGLNF